MIGRRVWLCIWALATVAIPVLADSPTLNDQEAAAALRKAVSFFSEQVAVQGGYVWKCSADLVRREGEGKAAPSVVWVQPPGTPSVGDAVLKAYAATKDAHYLDAVKKTAYALVNGQLRSGGWDYRIEFDPQRRREFAYRVESDNDASHDTTTLDDDNTQSATRFLMHADKALGFSDARIHEAAAYALECLLKAQYPNGAWPQRYHAFPDPAQFPVKPASYPEQWSRTFEKVEYAGYYTLNDNTLADMIATMIEGYEVYGEERFRAAAEKAGNFILLAQMPDPQPAWAQQYDAEMHPAWARKFEPPAITGRESQSILDALLFLYQKTGKREFLDPIPRAVAYLRASQLLDGHLARFYELQTNTPLYFTKDYALTYSNADMPTHYAFIVNSGLDAIEQAYKQALDGLPAATELRSASREGLAERARAVVNALDERGAWVEDGRLNYHGPDDPTTRIIDCRTFIKNVGVLCDFLRRVRVGAYWWDGWVEGSPYIREPLVSEYKDREPVWGWRDDNQAAVDKSIRLAAEYGIDFFTFLWYPDVPWDKVPAGSLGVLNSGLRLYLSSTVAEKQRVGFSLMIALAPAQPKWEDTCRPWARECLKHERYTRVEGRPVLSFYDLGNLEKALGGRDQVPTALATLRRIAREEGCPDPFLVLRASGDEHAQLRELGFDGATDYAIAYTPEPGEHPYSDLVNANLQTWRKYEGKKLNYMPSVTAGWDGRPREWMNEPYYRYWYRRSPGEFGDFVKKGLDWIHAHPDDAPATPLLMIYAWNEVDEGGWICPTVKDGPAYLNALQRTLGDYPDVHSR